MCFLCLFVAIFLLWLFEWLDGDKSAAIALIFKLDDSVDFGEQRVIFADADVQAGFELRSTLPDKNGSTGHDLAAKTLHAEPLRVAIAAVS